MAIKEPRYRVTRLMELHGDTLADCPKALGQHPRPMHGYRTLDPRDSRSTCRREVSEQLGPPIARGREAVACGQARRSPAIVFRNATPTMQILCFKGLRRFACSLQTRIRERSLITLGKIGLRPRFLAPRWISEGSLPDSVFFPSVIGTKWSRLSQSLRKTRQNDRGVQSLNFRTASRGQNNGTRKGDRLRRDWLSRPARCPASA